MLFRRHQRRREIAERLQALREPHPTGTIDLAWDKANTPEDDEVEAVVRAAAGRLVRLSLPTSSPWLNPVERLWRPFRREVTHCELLVSLKALLAAARDFFDRSNQSPDAVRSIIAAHPAHAT